MKPKQTRREWKVWVPPFVVSTKNDQEFYGERLPFYRSKAVGQRHWSEVVQMTLTLSKPKRRKAK